MSNNYIGVIIEEGLEDKSILKKVKILKTDIEKVIEAHKTPWLKQWTLHTIEVPEEKVDEVSEKISRSFDKDHPDWYADYKNDKYHYIIFDNKTFRVNISKPKEYRQVVAYGLSLGIPDYQLDFAPDIKQWER